MTLENLIVQNAIRQIECLKLIAKLRKKLQKPGEPEPVSLAFALRRKYLS